MLERVVNMKLYRETIEEKLKVLDKLSEHNYEELEIALYY